MISDKQKKVIYYIVLGIGIAMLTLIVILTPIMTDKGLGNVTDPSLITLMVMIPFLVSIICFVGLKWFVSYTTNSALSALERQFHNNKIDIAMYKKIYEHIVMFDLEKSKLEFETKTEREKIKSEAKEKGQKKLTS